jgi:hypothetical protein
MRIDLDKDEIRSIIREEIVNKIVYAIFEEIVSLEDPEKTIKELMLLLKDVVWEIKDD